MTFVLHEIPTEDLAGHPYVATQYFVTELVLTFRDKDM